MRTEAGPSAGTRSHASAPALSRFVLRRFWPAEAVPLVGDAITPARRRSWTDWVFSRAGHDKAFATLPAIPKETLLYGLAPAAWPGQKGQKSR